MTIFSKITFLMMALVFTSTVGTAQTNYQSSKKKYGKKTVLKKGTRSKKKTVGDMMQEFDAKSRGSNPSIQKRLVALPEVPAQKPSTVPMYEVKPPRSGDLFREAGTDEEKLEQITDQGINQLYGLSQQYSQSKNRGQLWLRLAELYVEKAKYIEYRLQKEFDTKINLYLAKKILAKPKLNLTKAREYNLKAIKLYEWFLHDFPKDAKADQALFFLGYNHIEMDQVKRGVAYYQQLTKEYPNSPYVGEAYFALGEYYFDNNKWADAIKSYSDVLKNRRARLYTFALYKIAWCQYRMGRVGQGLKTLEEVVTFSRSAGATDKLEGRRSVSKIRLGSEALKDIVLFYGDVGNYSNARDYFFQIGGEKAQYPMLEKLAYLYSDTGKKEQAQFVFKQLLEHNPTAPKAFDYQFQIVSSLSTSKNQRSYRDELYTWIDNYAPGSAWAEANAANKKLLEDSYTLRESALRNYTLLLHKNAQNSQHKPDLLTARDAYQLYLSRFGDSAKSMEMHFFFAELLYSLNDFTNAAKEYRFVADKDPKGKYFEPSVLNTLLSIEKGLKSDEQIKQVVGESLEPVPFGEVETAFISAGDRYVKSFPRGEKVVEVKFKMGRLHYAYNHFPEAIAYFKEITATHPRTPYAVYSANLILDIFNLKKDYDGLSTEGLKLMKNHALIEQGFQTDVRDLVEKANFKKAQDLEVQKNYEGSAAAFADFSRNHPHSPLTESAIFNSAVNYERAHKLPEAIAMYSKVTNNPSKTNAKFREKSSLLLARLYEQTAQYDKAAVLFEKYAKENPHDKLTPDLYYNSAVIWEGQNEIHRAILDYQKYYDSTRRRDRNAALFTIASIHEKAGHLKMAQDGYRKYLDAGGGDSEKVVEATFKIAELYERRGYHTDAEKGYGRTVAIQKGVSKGKPVGLAWAAEAKFKLTEKVYDEFTQIRIPANPKKQAEAVKQKLALLTKLSNNLADVIKYDDGNMVIASLTKLGQAYDHMSRAIWKAPLPKDLNAQEMETYKKGVDSVAQPLKARAVENFTAAVTKSYEINYYNKWTKVALEAMAKFQPDKFSEPKEVVIPVAKADDVEMQR